MRQIKFKTKFLSMIRGGQKTQTRRPANKPEYHVGEALQIVGACDCIRITHKHKEPLHNITEAGAKAEGMTRDLHGVGYIPAAMESPCVYQFARCWDDIYGPGAWEENPIVCVYEFVLLESRS